MTALAAPHPDRDSLLAFSQGRMNERQLAEVSRHLGQCSSCRAIVEGAPPDGLQSVLRQNLRPPAAQPVPPSIAPGADFQGKAQTVGYTPPASGSSLPRGTANPTVPVPSAVPASGPGLPDVPGFQVAEVIGQGGMGIVYKAYQLNLKRWVALKMIKDEVLNYPGALSRFQKEAAAIAHLQHPNIIAIHEVAEHQGRYYFSLEYVDGGSLATCWDHKPQNPREVARLLEVVARAAHEAHQHNIIHRDLKPANILLANPRRPGGGAKPGMPVPKISDFGLAKRLDVSTASLPPGVAGSVSISMTSPGQLMGTPEYMAPEQIVGQREDVGPAADIYALGGILYAGLTGKPPFQGAAVEQTLDKVLSQEPVPPSQVQPGVPASLEAICLKCLSKDPKQRYATAEDLADDLHRFSINLPVSARSYRLHQKAALWAKRQPLPAATLAASLLFLFVSLTMTAVANSNASAAKYNAEREREQAEIARENEKIAVERKVRLERADYDYRIALAERSWRYGQVERALQILDSHRDTHADAWEWKYLLRICHADRMELKGHAAAVRSLACDSKGRWLASAGDDGTVRLWSIRTGEALLELSGHRDRINRAVFSPDGNRLVSASDDGTVRVWSLSGEEGRPQAKLLHLHEGHILPVLDVAFTGDGEELVSSGADTTIQVWKAGGGGERRVLARHEYPVNALALRHDGKELASADELGRIKLWDMKTGEAKDAELNLGRSAVNRIAYAPDGSYLVLALENGAVKWDLKGKTPSREFEGYRGGVLDVSFRQDGKRMVTANFDQTVRAWDPVFAREKSVFRGHVRTVNSACFSPDGKKIFSAGGDHTVKVWDADDPQAMRAIPGHDLMVSSVAFSKDGQRVVSGSYDRSVKVWDAGSAQELSREPKAVMGHQKIERDEPVPPADIGVVRKITTERGHREVVFGVAISPDGRTVASAAMDNTARLWNADTGAQLYELKHAGGVASVAFSPDGQLLATGSWDDQVRLWDPRTGRLRRVLTGHTNNVSGVAFSPDGKTLASSSFDRTVRLWDVETGQQNQELKGHDADVQCVAFSFDGKRLISGGKDRIALVWDLEQGKPMLKLEGHVGWVGGAAFSPDGSRIATAGGGDFDQAVRLWDAANGQELLEMRGGRSSVASSPDGLAVFFCPQ